MEIITTQGNTVNKYLISMRKANKKYRETHKEKFNEYQKKYYHDHKQDEVYMNRQREKAKRYYQKKKLVTKEEEVPETKNPQNI
jgi:hypothetical protein